MVGLGAWSLPTAALILLLLPRSEYGWGWGAGVRGEVQGEISGVEDRFESLH